jgi:hypothetical protein
VREWRRRTGAGGRGLNVTERKAVRGRARRRLIAVAALGVLLAGALAGCRSQTGTAAYVGDTRITEAHIDSVVDTVKLDGLNVTNDIRGNLRQFAVRNLAFIALAEQYAASKNITLPPVTDDQAAQFVQTRLNLPSSAASSQFFRDWAQADLDESKLAAAETPVTPTDAQLRDIYARAVAGGVTTATFASVKSAIENISGLGQALALQSGLAKTEKANAVQVNPRYYPAQQLGRPEQGLDYPLIQVGNPAGQLVDVVVTPLGKPTPAPVVDVPQTPTPTPTPSATGGTAP